MTNKPESIKNVVGELKNKGKKSITIWGSRQDLPKDIKINKRLNISRKKSCCRIRGEGKVIR